MAPYLRTTTKNNVFDESHSPLETSYGSRARRGARFQRAVSPLLATYPRPQARGAMRQSVEAGAVAADLRQEQRLWRREQQPRDNALEQLRARGREDQLRTLHNRLSTIGFEKVRPQIEDEELTRVAAGAALWTASQAIVWALASDAFGNGDNPVQPKLEIFQLGRRPGGTRDVATADA